MKKSKLEIREAAQRDTTFVRRVLEETALTTIYLATFAYWMQDDSKNSQNTRDFLACKLLLAESLDRRVYGTPHKETMSNPAAEPTPAPEASPVNESPPRTVTTIMPETHARSG